MPSGEAQFQREGADGTDDWVLEKHRNISRKDERISDSGHVRASPKNLNRTLD